MWAVRASTHVCMVSQPYTFSGAANRSYELPRNYRSITNLICTTKTRFLLLVFNAFPPRCGASPLTSSHLQHSFSYVAPRVNHKNQKWQGTFYCVFVILSCCNGRLKYRCLLVFSKSLGYLYLQFQWAFNDFLRKLQVVVYMECCVVNTWTVCPFCNINLCALHR